MDGGGEWVRGRTVRTDLLVADGVQVRVGTGAGVAVEDGRRDRDDHLVRGVDRTAGAGADVVPGAFIMREPDIYMSCSSRRTITRMATRRGGGRDGRGGKEGERNEDHDKLAKEGRSECA